MVEMTAVMDSVVHTFSQYQAVNKQLDFTVPDVMTDRHNTIDCDAANHVLALLNQVVQPFCAESCHRTKLHPNQVILSQMSLSRIAILASLLDPI